MISKKRVFERLMLLFTENLGTKLVSVGIAIVLWGIVLGSRNVEVTKEIPLELITSADIVASNEVPDRIAFRLSGPKAFLRSILDRREDPIQVNLIGEKPALVTYRFFSDNIRVPIGVKVLSIHPPAILLKLEPLKRLEVPVKVELRGVPPEGYRIVRTEITPNRVRIKGAESRVDSVTELLTVPIDVSSLKKNLEKEVSIDLIHQNIQLDSELPKAFVEIEPISTQFRLKNIDIHVLSSYKSRIEEKNVAVLIRATSQDIESLDRNQVFGLVDMTGKPPGKYLEAVKISLPKHFVLVRVVPDHVKIVLY